MKDMINDLRDIINDNENTIIVGDFNLCIIDEKTNAITDYLQQVGFTQYVTEATHLGVLAYIEGCLAQPETFPLAQSQPQGDILHPLDELCLLARACLFSHPVGLHRGA